MPDFFFNDTATTEIYTLSLHDALPILYVLDVGMPGLNGIDLCRQLRGEDVLSPILMLTGRSEEHTSELQSQSNLVCRLLLEKKITSRPTRSNYVSWALRIPLSTLTCHS